MRKLFLLLPLSFAGCGSSNPFDGDLSVTSVSVTDDGAHLRLSLTVHNGHIRDVATYDTFRGMSYDETSRKLVVEWRERRCDADTVTCTHYMYPQYTTIAAGSSRVLEAQLPRTLVKVATPSGPGEKPTPVSVPIYDLDAADVELAWTHNPVDAARDTGGRKAVLAAEEGTVQASWHRAPGGSLPAP